MKVALNGQVLGIYIQRLSSDCASLFQYIDSSGHRILGILLLQYVLLYRTVSLFSM